MAWARAGLALGAVALALSALSGRHGDDAHTPAALPGLPPPFLGVAIVGSGRRSAAVDAYGDVVDLRAPGPAGRALVSVPAKLQVAGTVPIDAAVIARARLANGKELPFWRADSVRQRYVPGTNVLLTVARFGDGSAHVVRRIDYAEGSDSGSRGQMSRRLSRTIQADRRWLAQAQPLGRAAPGWARAMYRRSLLVLRALTDRRTGAVAAGARDGWAYVWPRDAGAVAIAFASAGYTGEAQRVARFLSGLDLDSAARFDGTGEPVSGRSAQGDALGWVMAARRAAGLPGSSGAGPSGGSTPWGRADYQEGDADDYLGNAIASRDAGTKTGPYVPKSARRPVGSLIAAGFGTGSGLARIAGDPNSGLDSAAAWAVRPFPIPSLFPLVRRTLLHLVAERKSRFGIVPSEGWSGGDDPWTAPTAWTAWALAALAQDANRGETPTDDGGAARGDRRAALTLMADLRRAATPLGLLPERVDARTGLPTSTTPLAWSHAFAILALRELWP